MKKYRIVSKKFLGDTYYFLEEKGIMFGWNPLSFHPFTSLETARIAMDKVVHPVIVVEEFVLK